MLAPEFAVWERIFLQPRESIFSSAIFTWIIYRDLGFLVLCSIRGQMSTCGDLRAACTRLRRVWRATFHLRFSPCICVTCPTLFVTRCHVRHLTSVHFAYGLP